MKRTPTPALLFYHQVARLSILCSWCYVNVLLSLTANNTRTPQSCAPGPCTTADPPDSPLSRWVPHPLDNSVRVPASHRDLTYPLLHPPLREPLLAQAAFLYSAQFGL